MRISSQSADVTTRSAITANASKNVVKDVEAPKENVKADSVKIQSQTENANANAQGEGKEAFTKEQLQQAVEVMNDLIDVQHKSSKFVFHEGLDKYYVKLVDSKTEEVIKEIPPERLLDAFYEMQKLTGMIVDEKI